ncbi:MAG: hypothetical protein EP330_05190 [Deltaproteobacteria bacterium]|nr:MAG: hypothetical protein EP330_05190 [Deltaproteobacteria bacterium]
MHRFLPVLALLAGLVACEEPPTTARPASQVPLPSPVPKAEATPTAKKWIKRTDLELDAELKQVCSASVADGKPILLEFSADWCVDCRRLVELGKNEDVAAELDAFHHLTVDVGQWDRHKPLIEAFGVGMLAWWAVLAPEDCDAPVPQWKRLKEGGFEPASSGAGARTAEDVLAWLRAARGA